jgi:hypothetical protein
LKTAYNDVISYNKERDTDFMKGILQAPVKLPVRPCKPDRPTQFAGIVAQFSSTKMSSWTTANKDAKWAEINQGLSGTDPTPVVASTLRSGFLQASTNTASTTTTEIANVGHVFGRMGQGERTMASYTLNGATVTNTAFQWKD